MNDEVIMIPIAEIHVLNPRHRDQKKFEVIVNSIKTLGLKMPITVSLRAENEPAGLKYDLVCGQGRMEAFIALGHLEIPAIVVEISKEERLIRSLVENIARRYPATMNLIREIERLRADGYTNHQISEKLDISDTMVSGLLSLKKAGEGRLLQAALAGNIPLWVAIGISKADTAEMQRELLKAYEGKQLNYMSLRMVTAPGFERDFAQRDTAPGGRVERLVILNDPPGRDKLRINLLAGLLFGSHARKI